MSDQPKPPTINSEWQRFIQMAISPDASELQLTECKRAFFAGGQSFFNCLQAQPQEASEDESINLLENLLDELTDFADKGGM